jgi:hypothetical protein
LSNKGRRSISYTRLQGVDETTAYLSSDIFLIEDAISPGKEGCIFFE